MADDLHSVLTSVGPRLRALRHESGATLAALAATTGISVSTLSRLESSQRRPTLELLLPLAQAHQVPLDELVGAPPVGDPRVEAESFVANGITFQPLTRRAGGIQAYKTTFPVVRARAHPKQELQVHEGYEWVYVLSGELRLVLGDRELILTVGEAAEFDTRVPHALSCAGTVPTEVLSLFGEQGERMHVRAKPQPKPRPKPRPKPVSGGPAARR